MCSNDPLFSEMQDNYRAPKLKRAPATRNKLMEQFLWQEFYDEYKRYYNRLEKVPIDPLTTEYYEEYCKKIKPEDPDIKEALMARYPLYCTPMVTLWNPDGDIKKDFKKRYIITRPAHECSEQFG